MTASAAKIPIRFLASSLALHAAVRIALVVVLYAGAAMPRSSMAQEPFTYLWVDANIEAATFGDLSWVDVDRDGDQDLLVLGGESVTGPILNRLVGNVGHSVAIRPDGSRFVAVTTELLTGFQPSSPLWLASVDWTDFDRDGWLDAAVSASASVAAPFDPSLRLYRNAASDAGVFTDLGSSAVPLHGVIEWGDMDNDGSEELLVVGSLPDGRAATRVYHYVAGSLVEAATNLPDLHYGSGSWADVDNDGDLDVALCGVTANGAYTLGVYRNDGSGTFDAVPIAGTGAVHCTLDWGDYDGDGFDDLLVTGGRIAPTEIAAVVDVYQNVAGSSFQRQSFGLIGLAAGEGRFLDIDADGFLDIALAGGSDVAFRRSLVTIYAGDGASFRRLSNLPGVFPAAMSLGDMDGDGDADLAVMGLGQDQQTVTTIYYNGSLVVNNAPTTPSGLQSDVDGGTATLRWDAAGDGSTPAASLTYNMRVGSVSGGNDVMSVPTLADGRPVRSSRGNVLHNTTWSIGDLPNGTYFWSVQAVDNSLAASSFSEESSFEITASAGGKPVANEDLPDAFPLALHSPYPNPAHGNVTFRFDLPGPGLVELEVFDVVGRRVGRPVFREGSAGEHEVV
ncbi:MAG: FG-GAP-like repeat-containing protein, partial [Rhodothermales bacterium]|nr:FG-GAP-like repeat-containing protein [Rhodothermales bacterium]